MGVVARGRRVTREYRRQPRTMRGAFVRSRFDGQLPILRATVLLRRLTGVSLRQAWTLLAEAELKEAQTLWASGEAEYRAAMPGHGAGTLRPEEGAFLYALVRAIAPRRIVETGTANGSSALYMLAALDRNDAGELISIDLPFVGADFRPVVAGTSIGIYDASPLPPGRQPGWLVPERLRGRWQLRIGDALELLPAVEAPVDLFLHDSLHTREHMLAEFRTIWPKLTAGGVLVSDDVLVGRHDALAVFAGEVGRRFDTFRGIGLIRRTG